MVESQFISLKVLLFAFSNKVEDVIMEQPDTNWEIGEDKQSKGFEKTTNEGNNWLDRIETDQEHVINVLRYTFAVCLVAVSAKIIFDIF